MVVISGVVYKTVTLMIESSEWVTHTFEVIDHGKELSVSLVDMETGTRGFMATGNEAFLEPYENGQKSFEKFIKKAKDLVDDNPVQLKRLENLEKLVYEWQSNYTEVAISKRREVKNDSIDAEYLQQLLKKGLGKRTLDKLRLLLDNLSANARNESDLKAELLILSFAKDMVDQETGQRGFLITGKKEFLEPFKAGRKTLVDDIDKLRQHFATNSENLALLAKAEFLADEWMSKAAIPEINARHEMNKTTTTMKDVISLMEASTGKQYMDTMRKYLADFVDTETDLMERRSSEAESLASSTINITVIGTLVALIFGGSLGLIIAGSMVRALRTLVAGAEAIGRGVTKHRINTGTKDEFSWLADAFNRMVQNLESAKGAAQATQRRLQAILDTVADGIITIDSDGAITSFNKTAERLFGYEVDKVLGKSIKILIPKAYHEELDDYLAHFLTIGEKRIIGGDREVAGRRKDGSTFPLEIAVSETQTEKGLMYTAIIRDISDRKLAEARVAHASKLATIGEMAAGMTHELSQPINLINLVAEAARVKMKNGCDDWESQKKSIRTIIHQCQRLSRIFHLMGSFSRKEDHFVEVFRVASAVTEACDLVKDIFHNDGIDIIYDIDPDSGEVTGQKIQLEQVIVNLLSNARDAILIRLADDDGPARGEIRVRCRTSCYGDCAVISVTDNGPGVPESMMEKIFDPFVTDKVAGNGTGLGLAVSQNLVNAIGGTIEAENTPMGARFTVSLPVTDRISDEPEEGRQEPERHRQTRQKRNRTKTNEYVPLTQST